MSSWREAEPEEIWKDIEKQRCLICGEEGVLRNNNDAWIKFMKVYTPLMWKKVNTHTPKSNREDVISDIYVKLLAYGVRAWCRNPRENFSAYLSRIVWSAICNDLEEKYFQLPQPEEENNDLESRRIETSMAPEDMQGLKKQEGKDVETRIIKDIDTENLREALLKFLSIEERDVVWLHNVEEYTIEDTARKLGKSENEIKTIHKRALRKLRSKEGSVRKMLGD